MFTAIDVLLAVCPLNAHFNQVPCDVGLCQAASGVTSSYGALLELFERLGNFLQRLEIYMTIPPTTMMTDIIVKILTEVLSVLGLATKELKQGRFSKCFILYTFPVAQCSIEKIVKKLLGNSDFEIALQKIDLLTQEEARMAGTQTLCAVHGLVDSVSVIMAGTRHCVFIDDCFWNVSCIRSQDVDMFVIPLILLFVAETDDTLLVTNLKWISNIGSPLRTLQQIMTFIGKCTTPELPHGSLRVMRQRNGKRRNRSCGSSANVRFSIRRRTTHIDGSDFIAGSGKSTLMYVVVRCLIV